MVVVGFT